jgi:hypothetical protein
MKALIVQYVRKGQKGFFLFAIPGLLILRELASKLVAIHVHPALEAVAEAAIISLE